MYALVSDKKCCITCAHCLDCPTVIQVVEQTDSPIEACSFFCSEFQPVGQ